MIEPEYRFRPPRDEDADAVVDIFNYYVENGFSAYREQKVDKAFFAKMRELAAGYPIYVAEAADGRVVGFGLLRQYHPGDVFKRVAELTYFIAPDHVGQGIGGRFLEMLSDDARKQSIDTLLASISSLNGASIRFHEKNGFTECGRFKRIGRKKDQDFDMVWMQKFI